MESRSELIIRAKSMRLEQRGDEENEALELFARDKNRLTTLLKDASFFKKLDENKDVDLTIIVDRSGSMKGSRWKQARKAVELLAAEAVLVTLYFN